jgi:hypothetical protein
MKLQITHMKAPWPAGAKVGDVLELPAVPAWALGKCRQVGGDGSGEALPPIDSLPVIDEPKAKSKK